MLVDNLTTMVENPYSEELNFIIKKGMDIFEQECKKCANQGERSIITYLNCPDDSWSGTAVVNFGESYEGYRYVWCYKIPNNMLNILFERAQTQIRTELFKRGFTSYKVEDVIGGPFYPPLRLFGNPSMFKDKSKPYYSKKIKIMVHW